VGRPNTSHESGPVRGSGPPDLGRWRALSLSTRNGREKAEVRPLTPATPRNHHRGRGAMASVAAAASSCTCSSSAVLSSSSSTILSANTRTPRPLPHRARLPLRPGHSVRLPRAVPPDPPRPPWFRLTAADHLPRIVSAGAEVSPEMRLGEAGRRTRWVVVGGSEGGPARGSGRVVQARAVRRVVVRNRARDGGGGDNAPRPRVAAGARRHAVLRPAAG